MYKMGSLEMYIYILSAQFITTFPAGWENPKR